MGMDGTVVDLMIISGGSSDVEQFTLDSEAFNIVVQCFANSTTVNSALSITPCI